MPKNNNQPIDPKRYRQERNNGASKTELVWPGKRKEVERVELPFQTIETINLPRGVRQEELFGAGSEEGWKNRLIWGDNLLIMGSLLKEFAGKINLIYIDPPFATGDDFSFTVNIGDPATAKAKGGQASLEVTKEPSALEVKAYRDTWGKGMQSYLQMMYDRLVLMKELLADDGSIYVHLDYRMDAYIRAVMDEVFGQENYRNEIIWNYVSGGISEKFFARKHDTILFYSKSHNYIFNPQKERKKKYDPSKIQKDEKGEFVWYIRPGTNPKVPKGVKSYIDKYVQDVWEIPIVNPQAYERLDYPTQKPEALLERIIKASSNKGDLVADFFCGSGTTGVVAEKLGRRWIMSDLGRFAIHTTRKRLLDMGLPVRGRLLARRAQASTQTGAKPFVVQNLGKYERHRWAKLNGRYKDYIKFILELYHAEPVDGFTHLHGKKAKSFVRVGTVDAPVTLSEIREALSECKENKIKKLDVLGWEWEMGLHDLVKEEAEKYGVKLATLQIPREVMELSPTDARKHDIQFFELAYLEVEAKVEGKRAIITLKDFIIPNPELLPEEVKGKVKSWSDFIDYWAVDWDFNGDSFHNMNQRYRTRKEPKLELSMSYDYKKSGKYNILVKVIDIFGNDTTKMVEIKVK